ncbi:hypothetical protein V8G54_005863 [Vigna mungo]|uniref:Ribosomal protein L17 n=1 Tax=Vigna mungo TaxID=3915 RepID=A0AAQ3S7G8_VIGMU
MTKFRMLGRPTDAESWPAFQLYRTMVSQLVKHKRIETTVAKAKEIRRLADNMVQLGKELLVDLSSNITLKTGMNLLRGWLMREIWKYDYLLIVQFVLGVPIWHMASWGLGREFCMVNYEGSQCAASRAASFVRGDDVLHKLFTELAYRYRDRAGGYTRLLRTRIRVGDAAPMAYIEFIDRENELRQPKPPTPQSPQRAPLDPWTRSRLSRQFAPPKEGKSGSDL